MTFLESSSAGTPVLARNLDVYRGDPLNNVIKAADNEGFEAVIRKMKENPSLLADAAEKSKRIADTCSEGAVYEKWKEFYTRIFSDGSKS